MQQKQCDGLKLGPSQCLEMVTLGRSAAEWQPWPRGSHGPEVRSLPPQDKTGARLVWRSRRCTEANFSSPAYTEGKWAQENDLACSAHPAYGKRSTKVQNGGRKYTGRPLVGERWYVGGMGRAETAEAEGAGQWWPEPRGPLLDTAQ